MQNMAKSHKSCMEQAEIIDTFGTYQKYKNWNPCTRYRTRFVGKKAWDRSHTLGRRQIGTNNTRV